MSEVTRILIAIEQGDPSAVEQLQPPADDERPRPLSWLPRPMSW